MDLKVKSVDFGEVSLTWKPPKEEGSSPITHYSIEMWEVGLSQEWAALENTESCACRVTIRNKLNPTAQYRFRVRAVNANAGAGEASEPTNDITVPGEATYDMPTVGEVGDLEAEQWEALESEFEAIPMLQVGDIDAMAELLHENRPARFVTPLDNKIIDEGTVLKLLVRCAGSQPLAISWQFNGQDQLPTEAQMTQLDDNTGMLVIPQFFAEHAGTYSATVSNDYGQDVTSCVVDVITSNEGKASEPQLPEIVTPLLPTTEITENDTLVLKVIARGATPLFFDWLHDDAPIETLVMSKDEDGKDAMQDLSIVATPTASTMTLRNVKKTYQGTVRCVVRNRYGRVQTRTLVSVISDEKRKLRRGLRQPPSRPLTDETKHEQHLPPEIVYGFSDTTAHVGATVELECIVTGKPMPQATWFLDDIPIDQLNNVPTSSSPADKEITPSAEPLYQTQVASEGKRHILRIRCLDFKNSGIYKCVVRNEYGHAICSAYVHAVDLRAEAER